MTRIIHCHKLNEEAEGLKNPPFPGELGDKIFQKISQKAWNLWIENQTLLINEYRLSLIDPKARDFLRQEMDRYFFGDGGEKPSGYVPKE